MKMSIETAKIILPMLLAFVLSAASGKVLIPYLRRLKAGQTEREDGPKSHLSKSGTPNMGGLMILFSMVVTGICFFHAAGEFVPVLILTVGFGLVGFVDDYIKVVQKRSMGLRAWQKILLQVVIALIFAFYISEVHHIPMGMKMPFMPGVVIDLGIFNIPFLVFVSLAVVNGTNLNDGVDGMAGCVAIAVSVFFTIAAVLFRSPAAAVTAAMIGALLGFLVYNAYPAKVFMGDTGSLALGGFVVGVAYLLRMPLFIPVVGIIYVLEVLSVIIQVGYFKASHGKRFFRMAPLHHHYELGGWSEVRVVTVFTVITVVFGAAGLLGIW